MVIRADLNAVDHVQIAPGMQASVYLDAYPHEKFSATVQSVSPVATAPLGSPVRSFTVILSLTQRDDRLMPDLDAAVDLRLPPPPDALLIPRTAVRFVHDQAWVRAQRHGYWQWQPVALGAFDNTRIAVLSGLKAGETIERAPLEAVPQETLAAATRLSEKNAAGTSAEAAR